MSATLEQECCLPCENANRCFDSGDRNVTYASALSRGPTCTCICLCETRSASLLTNRARQKSRGATSKTKNKLIFPVGCTYLLTQPSSPSCGLVPCPRNPEKNIPRKSFLKFLGSTRLEVRLCRVRLVSQAQRREAADFLKC